MQSSFELTPKQAEYIRNAHHRWNVSCGAVRSGKSYLQISYLIPSRLFERQGLRGLIVFLGATRANIERNILQPLRDLYGSDSASEINSKNWAKVFGIKVYCIGADNIKQVSKLKGSEISYCAVDEATDINQEVFEMLKSRLSLPWSCCDITTNPASPNHWFKKFLDSQNNGVDIYLQEYTIYDNPFLPPDYVRNLEAEYRDTVWFDRYILGKWTLAEGLVYPHFKECLVGGSLGPAEEYALSIDYGTSNPFAVLLWGRRGDVWTAEDELYYSGRDTGIQKTDEEYLEQLYQFTASVQLTLRERGEDVEIPVVIDPSAASFIALLRQTDEFLVRTSHTRMNLVLEGIRQTASCMHAGVLKVHTRLANWMHEVQSYVWDAESLEDKVIKANDHLMDAMRYFVMVMRVKDLIEEEE